MNTQNAWSLFWTLIFSSSLWGINAPAFSQSRGTTANSLEQDLESYLNFLADANHYSPLEGAGSHGSIGIGLGIGASRHQVPEHKTLLEDQLRSRESFNSKSSQEISSSISIPRIYLHKGLPFPIDLGLTAAMIPGTEGTSAGTYIQWTVFERFALPAIAVRGMYSRLMGLPSTEFQTIGTELVASFGFLRYLNAYATYGLNNHSAIIKTTGESGTALAITKSPEDTFESSKTRSTTTFGLQAQIFPPYCNLSVERRSSNDSETWTAKIGVGM
jgi:hypothetical protein